MTNLHPIVRGDGLTPGLQLQLVDSDDEPLEEGAVCARRPSTASLSRFRSCPQLSSADASMGQDSPASDDHFAGAELCVGGHLPQSGSPRARHRPFYVDSGAGGRSQTPTPPSTPGSRRSHQSLKESTGPGSGGGGAAAARMAARGRMDQNTLLSRTASTDSQHHDNPWRPLEENHLRLDDQASDRGSRHMSEFFDEPPDISIDDRLTATEDGASAAAGGEGRYQADDSMDKCARWLQSLKMTSSDRLKSRSHIQLPPI